MIIDAHCHIWDKKLISTELKNFLAELSARYNFSPELIMNGTAERLIREMDEAGIDKTVVVALDYDFIFEGEINFREYNDYVANLLKIYPDRLIGFCGIDLRRGKAAIKELDRCISTLEFSGVKVWPLAGFYPDDPRFYPFYERVQDLGVPILCHTGSGPPFTYMKYARPVYVDTIAVDFPKINFQMAHIGDPWTDEAIAIARKNKNVFFDISGLEPMLKSVPAAFAQILIQAKMACGIEKILFGSDWPLFAPVISLKKWVNGIRKLKVPPPLQLMGLPEFTEMEKSFILGGNAEKMLGI